MVEKADSFGVHGPRRSVVAIPAKDEANHIGPCLTALAVQRGRVPDAVVLCLNNCTDGTAAVVREASTALPFPVQVIAVSLRAQRACAGAARRIAMNRAALIAGSDGVVLTTDADGQVAPDWLAANCAAIAEGADAVAGQADIDPDGAALIPPHLHAIDRRECGYAALLDEIASLLDPDPADPWPRHDEHSGASIAVTVEAYRRAGGMPASRIAEDRDFFDALRRIDARIRHSRQARVTVSARIVGRAQGGMADTIRRRIEAVDPFLDDRLEPVADAMRRIRLRAALRSAWRAGRRDDPHLAARLGVALAPLLTARHFGEAWQRVEKASPILQRQRVALAKLVQQSARAERLRDRLRDGVQFSAAEDRAGIPLAEAAE